MRKVTFYPEALQELFDIASQDKQAFKRIEKLLKDILLLKPSKKAFH